MTIGELKSAISHYDDDMLVVGRLYVGGYDDVNVSLLEIQIDNIGEDGKKKYWRNGKYNNFDADDGHDKIDAVLIG